MRLSAVWPVLIFLVILILVDEFISFLVLYLPPLEWLGDFSFLDYFMNIIRSCAKIFFAVLHLAFMVPGAVWLIPIDEILLAGGNIIIEFMGLIGWILSPVVGDFVKSLTRIVLELIFGTFLTGLVMAILYPSEGISEEERSERLRRIMSRRG